jgi:predicted amidophosphoribosyltransferase
MTLCFAADSRDTTDHMQLLAQEALCSVPIARPKAWPRDFNTAARQLAPVQRTFPIEMLSENA